jgi:hypothetical protein
MSSRRHVQRALLGVVLLGCSSGSAAPSLPAPTAVGLGDAAALVAPLRTADQVAPVAVDLEATAGASTTTRALPPVPLTLSAAGIPGRALVSYRTAAARLAAEQPSCRLPWPLLAGIGFVESGHGTVHGGAVGADGRATPPILGPRLDGSGAFALIRDTDGGRIDGDAALDRAVGPMQFIPSTWARHGADGDADARRDPHDLDDAALAAGRYLCFGSRRLDRTGGLIAAVFSYNHSYDYVRVVLTAAARYAGEPTARWGVHLLPAPTVEATPSASPSPAAAASVAPDQASTAPAPEPTPQADPPIEQSGPPSAEPEPTAEPTEPAAASPEPEPAPEPSPTG